VPYANPHSDRARQVASANSKKYYLRHLEQCRAKAREQAKIKRTESPELVRQSHSAWRKNNPEKCLKHQKTRWEKPIERAKSKERNVKWKKENRQRYLDSLKSWYSRNRSKVYEDVKKWRAANPLARSGQNARRRTRKINAEGSHTQQQWLARVQFYGWKCGYCAIPLTIKTLTKDHRIPFILGGSNWASNLIPACNHCNAAKQGKHPKKFRMAA
jgi:5-methylcytosine-specific restriction endonuclease McrA